MMCTGRLGSEDHGGSQSTYLVISELAKVVSMYIDVDVGYLYLLRWRTTSVRIGYKI
jgi:hypothetical protein